MEKQIDKLLNNSTKRELILFIKRMIKENQEKEPKFIPYNRVSVLDLTEVESNTESLEVVKKTADDLIRTNQKAIGLRKENKRLESWRGYTG